MTNEPMRRALLHLSGLCLLLTVGCGGAPKVDRTGWECWEDQPCAEGFACNTQHRCEEILIADIPGVDPIALSSFNEGIRAMSETPPDYEAARAAFGRSIERDPDFWEAYENAGLIEMDLGRYREAAELFRREAALIDELIERNWPVEPRIEVYLNIGTALALAGDAPGATEAYGRMLQLDPDNVEVRANLAALNLQQGNTDGARRYVQELLVMSQNDVGALSTLALIAKEDGDLQLASYLWEKCLQEIDAATAMLAVDCSQVSPSGDSETLSPEEVHCAQFEGMTDEEAAARRSYNARRAARMQKLLSDIQNELGVVAWDTGDRDGAESFFRRAVDNNPSNYAAMLNLGSIYLEYGFWQDACDQFDASVALRPRNQSALTGRAACAYGAGEIEMAVERYEAVHRQFPNDTFATEALADIAFQDLADYPLALDWFGRHLSQKGTNLDSCNPDSDPVCRRARSVRDVMRQQREMEQQSGQP